MYKSWAGKYHEDMAKVNPKSKLNKVLTYRVISYTWPYVYGSLKKVTCPLYACTVLYCVTFHKVPEKHGLVTLYNRELAIVIPGSPENDWNRKKYNQPYHIQNDYMYILYIFQL